MHPKRVVIGITGASAPIYGVRLLEMVREMTEVEAHLICTRGAERTLALETDYTLDQVRALAGVCYPPDDFAAAISSGSFQTSGMIVAPCSINTVACIAASVTKDLLTRAADVTLKEKRPLVLLVRESPLHLGHLRRLVELAEMGAHIAPPIPSFYHCPESIDDIITHSLGRSLELLGLEVASLKRWSSPQ